MYEILFDGIVWSASGTLSWWWQILSSNKLMWGSSFHIGGAWPKQDNPIVLIDLISMHVPIRMRSWSFQMSSPWVLLPGQCGSSIQSRQLLRCFRCGEFCVLVTSYPHPIPCSSSPFLSYRSTFWARFIQGQDHCTLEDGWFQIALSSSSCFLGFCFDGSQSKWMLFEVVLPGNGEWETAVGTKPPNISILRPLGIFTWLIVM